MSRNTESARNCQYARSKQNARGLRMAELDFVRQMMDFANVTPTAGISECTICRIWIGGGPTTTARDQ
jgi:hypothetical protein